MLDDIFQTEKTYTATIKTKTQTNTNGKLGTISWPTRKTGTCIFWRGSISKRFFSERINPEIEAVAIFDPASVAYTDIRVSDQIVISDGATTIGTFAVIGADDIAQQNEILVVPLKEFK